MTTVHDPVTAFFLNEIAVLEKDKLTAAIQAMRWEQAYQKLFDEFAAYRKANPQKGKSAA